DPGPQPARRRSRIYRPDSLFVCGRARRGRSLNRITSELYIMPCLLVVDDEPNIVFSLDQCLRSPSLKVISAGTAREGIELVRSERPDVVILDVRLPDMSGLDAYDRIRATDPRLPVIMVTAYARTETAIEAMRRGAYEYLLKPVDLRRIKDVVTRALE